MEQRDAAWHEARRTVINASEAGGLLGLSPYTSAKAARKAWIDKYRGARRDFSNADMQRGVDMEAGILDKLEHILGEVIQQDAGREYAGWLRASADGYNDGLDGTVFERKAPRKFFHLMERPDYLLQLYLQMVCYGADRGVFAQGVMNEFGTLETTDRTFTLDELAVGIDAHTDGSPPLVTLKALHAEMVNEAEQEPVEEEVFSNEEWEICSTCYAEAKAEMAEAKAKMDIYRDRMLAACDNKAVRGRRFMVIEATRTGSLNAKKLQTEHPDIDLDIYRAEPTTYMTIRETK